MTRHRCSLEVWVLAQSRVGAHAHPSLVTPERVLSEHNKDWILIFLTCRIRLGVLVDHAISLALYTLYGYTLDSNSSSKDSCENI